MTKSLRWDIQTLGVRLAKAAAAEESSRKKKTRAFSKEVHQFEIRSIIKDIRKLLAKIEKEVPLISLAITASGAKISTTIPASVSPSRMMQAGLYLAESNQAYYRNPDANVQVGPTFTLSLYMLFVGHSNRVHENADNMRETIWKEVVHKARCKLMRVPLHTTNVQSPAQILQSVEDDFLRGKSKHDEYAYHIEIIEDLDDDRVHAFEDDETQPGPYGGVKLAGIRDFLPVHQISKIFYADTGKILGIGNDGEPNSPVLLLKRDINAQPPRKMMEESEKNMDLYRGPEEDEDEEADDTPDELTGYESGNDSQDDIDAQIRRESSVAIPATPLIESTTDDQKWRLPADLDTEWLAFEVYVEEEVSDSEEEQDEQDENNDSAYISHRPSSSGEGLNGETVVSNLADLDLNGNVSPDSARQARRRSKNEDDMSNYMFPNTTVRTSLSSLELLIRLASLQQYTQAPYLCATDEIINFFLEDSSTTGAGLDENERRRTRSAARQKVGFDPYDESPIKRHGEDYQNQNQGSGYSARGNTPFGDEEYIRRDSYEPRGDSPTNSSRWSRESSMPHQRTPEQWMRRRNGDSTGSASRGTPEMMSSPISPYRPQQRKAVRPLDRVQAERGVGKGSPLGRGMSVETDSTLGTSPGSPTFVDRNGKA
jgi:hypothetical protein